MGAWDVTINGNDTFLDVYSAFFELYNKGDAPVNISLVIRNDFSELFEDKEDRNNSLFALALAQWETKSLEPELLNHVKQIVESGNDIELWRSLSANEDTLIKREKELGKFLSLISKEREKAKRRIKPKFQFESNELVALFSPDNQKRFVINEYFINKKYRDTGGGIEVGGGGGAVFYFEERGKHINAWWLDNQTVEIRHVKDIVFTKKEENVNGVKFVYKPKE